MNDKHTPTPGPWKAIEVGQGGPHDNPMPIYEIQPSAGGSDAAAPRAGQRHPAGDWVGDSEPGGCECHECGCIFIGDEYRDKCKECA